MNKFKNLLAKMSGEVKELGKRFPLTMGIVVFLTLLITVVIDQSFPRSVNQVLEKVYLFCASWVLGTFFSETFFTKKVLKAVSYGITGGVSFIFTMIFLDWEMITESQEAVALRFFAAYSIILVLMSMYKSMKNAELKFQEYVLKMFRDAFHVTVIYSILNIGFLLLIAIFAELILDGEYGSLVERILTLLLGLFYVPAGFYTMASISKKEVNSFIKGLVLYVLLPLVTIAIAIIYVYIAKIIILRDMPQNMIFRILAGIFVVAFPVWNMAHNYAEEKKLVGKLVTILPYLFAPLLLLEIYSIGIRIYEFGLTDMRYMSCAFVLFQACCLALTFYKKQEKISQIFLYGVAIILVTFVTPFNFQRMSNFSQSHVIGKLLPEGGQFEELSKADKKRVNSAYEYLNLNNGEKEIPVYLSEEEREKIKNFNSWTSSSYRDTEYISLHNKLEYDIGEYTRIVQVSGNLEEETKNIFLEEVGLTVDFSEKLKEIIDQNEMGNGDLDDYFVKDNLMKIDEKHDMYISNLYFEYRGDDKSIVYMNFEGYVLTKVEK